MPWSGSRSNSEGLTPYGALPDFVVGCFLRPQRSVIDAHERHAETRAERASVRRAAVADPARSGAEPLRSAPRLGLLEARGPDADLLLQDPRRLQQDRPALRGRARRRRDPRLRRE